MGNLDDNREYVSLVVTDDANLTPTPLKVDPVTGYLLIEVSSLAEIARTVNPAKIDENKESASLLTGDDGEIYPLLIDNRNGYLLADIA